VKRYTNEVLSVTTGLSVIGATVAVFVAKTDTLAVLYPDDDVTSEPKLNPFASGFLGDFSFYATDGVYDFRVTRAGRVTWLRDIEIVDLIGVKELISLIPAGPAANSWPTLAGLKAAPISNRTAYLASPTGSDSGILNGPFVYQTGDFSARSDVVEVNGIPLTTGALVRPSAAASLYSDARTNIVLPLDRSLPRTLSYMGVDPFTSVSQTPRIISAFANASADGLKLKGQAEARYAKDAPVYIGCDFDGQGCEFVGSGASNGMQLGGAGRVWKNFKNLGASSARTSQDATDGGFYITASNFIIDNIEAGRVEAGKGHGAAAIFFAGAKGGRIYNTTAIGSFADGHHCSDGCEDLTFRNPMSREVGDDGFAVVSYDYQGTINKRIHTVGFKGIDCKARGLSVLGCLGSIHKFPSIIRSSAAAIYIVSEGSDSFNTLASRYARVEGFYAEDCVTAVDRPGLSQAIVLIAGRSGSATLADGSVEPFSVRDAFVGGEIVGAGAAASYAIRTDSDQNYRVGLDIVVKNMSGPMTADACVQIGGKDGYGRGVVIDGCDGYPFLFMPSMTGNHAYDTLQAVNARRKSPSINEALHGSAANNWLNLHVDYLNFPDPTITPAGNMDLDKLSWRIFRCAGNLIGHP